ncbi:MAG: HPr(Ser) kinase/phosphatase [bacterium]|nr:HPr(Ser) kinase/phosphatase [bacterium]
MIRNKEGVEVHELTKQGDLEIVDVHNEKWLSNKICHPRVQKPGLALAGYFKYLDKDRLQIFGTSEIGYLEQLDKKEAEKRLKDFMNIRVPGIIVSGGRKLDDQVVEKAFKSKIPILVCNLRTSLLMSRISSFLHRHFTKKEKINGVMMDIMGQGILIKGQSGIGKSETALELVNKGHQLISDDLVEFHLNSNDEPVGRSLEKIKKWLEVRGLGVLNIIDLFGVGALLEEKKLDLVINIEKWNTKKQYDRLGEHTLYCTILGKDVPAFTLPVAAGRNISTLIEVAVKYFKSMKNGSESFIEHIYGKVEK